MTVVRQMRDLKRRLPEVKNFLRKCLRSCLS